MAKITFVLEDGQEVVVPLKEHITVGRDEDNDIVVDDERISPRHAELVRNADGSLQVFDLKSAAGTFVNGERQMTCTLLHGDKISFGPLNGTLDLEDGTAPEEPVAPQKLKTAPVPVVADQETGHLEQEKKRLKAEVAALEKELRDWQQRSEKERAMHSARVESLKADEERLAPVQAAVKDAEAAHREWLEAIAGLSSQHESKTAALERLNAQHVEKSTEVQRAAAEAEAAKKETEELTARLKQVRDDCEQDEAVLNTLRQQIIQMESDVKSEEASLAKIAESSAALEAKKLKTEASIKDLESLLTKLERDNADAEGKLQSTQSALTDCEKMLAACAAGFAAESQLMEKAKAQRAEIERQCQELAGTQQQLADAKRQLAAEMPRLEKVQSQRAEYEQQRLELESVLQQLKDARQQLTDTRQRLAAVEQRLRDAPNASPLAVHGSAPRAPQEEKTTVTGKPTAEQEEVMRQTEAARRQLAELEEKIARLRETEASTVRHIAAPAEQVTEAVPAGIPPPQIVHVDSIRLTPVAMKSERFRKLDDAGPAAKQPSPAPAPQVKSKKK